MPQLSVIIPAYNAERFLAAAIESALKNSPGLGTIEIIVVDDGSTDGTAAVAARYKDRVRFFAMGHCGLPAKVRNYGVDCAASDVIAFLDADDECLPGRFERQLALLNKTGADLVSCDARVEGANGAASSLLKRVGVLSMLRQAEHEGVIEDCFGLLIRTGGFINGGLMMVRHKAFRHAGGFNDALRIGEDYELATRLAAQGKVAMDFAPGVLRHEHGENLSSDWGKRWPDTLKLYELLASTEAVKARPELVESLRHRRAQACRGLGSWRLGQGDVEGAREAWQQGAELDPLSAAGAFGLLSHLPGGLLRALHWLRSR